jgi:RimJ/RimL family protein N-acetyltransferase
MSLSTSRLILRPWRDADLNAFARLNDDAAVMEFMGRHLSRDESDASAARLRADIEQRGWGAPSLRASRLAGASRGNDPLRPHVVYRLNRSGWLKREK